MKRFVGLMSGGLSVALLAGTAEAGWLDAVNKAIDTVNRVTNAVEAVKAVPEGAKGETAAAATAAPAAVAAPAAAPACTTCECVKDKPQPVAKPEGAKPVAEVQQPTSRPPLSKDELEDIRNGQPILCDMDDLKARMKQSKDYILVDVRKPREFRSGHIRGAINIPIDDISVRMPKVGNDLDKPIYLYCLSGDRAVAAGQKLVKMGYKRVYNFGGIDSWTGKLVKGK